MTKRDSQAVLEQVAELYERLIHVPIGNNLQQDDILEVYLRATLVAAGVSFDDDFFKSLLLQISHRTS